VAALGCLFACIGVEAAEITVIPVEGGPAVVTVAGDFLVSDIGQFREKTASLSRAIVAFRSPGGSLVAGIDIGEIIRLKGFATLVPSQMFCASACALAWLGGAPRYLAQDGRVGFHVAFVEKDGARLETGQGNAVLGAYLTRIGLPLAAVMYVTQAAPDSVTWLTFESAKEYGIDVVLDRSVPVVPEPTQAAPNAIRSYWNHNGSVVYLQADGYSRKFFYHQPRDGMLRAGAASGSLLFEGRKAGNRYVGQAYIFAGACGQFAYAVSGDVSNDDRRVVMRGRAPRVQRSSCTISGYLNDRLEFDYIKSQ
jgi:hypothetical protein